MEATNSSRKAGGRGLVLAEHGVEQDGADLAVDPGAGVGPAGGPAVRAALGGEPCALGGPGPGAHPITHGDTGIRQPADGGDGSRSRCPSGLPLSVGDGADGGRGVLALPHHPVPAARQRDGGVLLVAQPPAPRAGAASARRRCAPACPAPPGRARGRLPRRAPAPARPRASRGSPAASIACCGIDSSRTGTIRTCHCRNTASPRTVRRRPSRRSRE